MVDTSLRHTLISYEKAISRSSSGRILAQYVLQYTPSPRCWRRNSILVHANDLPNDWSNILSKLPQGVFHATACPTSLDVAVTSALGGISQDIEDDSELLFQPNCQGIEPSTHAGSFQLVKSSSQQVTKLVRFNTKLFGDLPSFLEKELVLLKRDDESRWLVYANTRTCLYHLWVSDYEQVLLLEIQRVREFDGVEGVGQFHGLVLDDNRHFIKGVLLALPSGPCKYLAMELIPEHTTWTRRERWARSLVKTVASAHAQGLVLGIKPGLLGGIFLSDDDRPSLQIWYNDIGLGLNWMGQIPPEYRSSYAWSEPVEYFATVETDLFNLGLVLWMFAEAEALHIASIFCDLAR
ncbi:hypothetical protein BT63DRAFT_288366 [Microthyrium microscopicum]|uniref:Protein kinase domain-containing protein n=1 Tax=Microthyrium microscopicum TaxID=703497 RepID=A0A6A6U7I6_9PEZI|nr:hypothetical protein BT63DRAFT_288366 [Microthyrium microscopicum]